MFQIIFTSTSTAEMSVLPKPLQLEILSEFQFLNPNFVDENPEAFGVIRQNERVLFRYRTREYRIYFEKKDEGLLIHRVLHKNSLKDFLFRSKLPVSEDEALQGNPAFWELIDSPKPKSD